MGTVVSPGLSFAAFFVVLGAGMLLIAPNSTAAERVEVVPVLPDTWMDSHRAKVAEIAARADEVQLLFIGDSITARWTSGAGREIWREMYEPLGAVNVGVSADRTEHVLWRLKNGLLDSIDPKAALVMIGTNNLGGSDPDAVAHGVWEIVRLLREKLPRTRVLVLAVFPRETKSAADAKVEAVNARLREFDTGGMVRFLDFTAGFRNPDGSLNLEWFPDGLHPETADAFAHWSTAITPFVQEALGAEAVESEPAPEWRGVVPDDRRPSTPATRNDWLDRHKSRKSRAAQGNCDLLFLGGSTMLRWERASELFEAEYGKWRPLNLSIFGTRAENLLWQIENGGLDGLAPRVCVVELHDDFAAERPVEQTVAVIQAVIQSLHNRLPDSQILLIGGFPVRDATKNAQITEANKRMAGWRDLPRFHFLDIGSAFVDSSGAVHTIPGPQPFDPEAYRRWADAQRSEIHRRMTSETDVE